MSEPRVIPSETGRPRDLASRLDNLTASWGEKKFATWVANELQGKRPAAVKGKRADDLARKLNLPLAEVLNALDLLERAGYGAPATRQRRDREHGSRLEARLAKVTLMWPRPIAFRYPTSDERRRSGENNGWDGWGNVSHNHTARAGHLGVIGLSCALWKERSTGSVPYVDVTCGEIAHVLRGAGRLSRRSGGGDIDWVMGLLRDLDAEELTADVDPKVKETYRIPEAPIRCVRLKVNGRWVSMARYDELRAAGELEGARRGQSETVRIYLAAWVLEAFNSPDAGMVFLSPATWRGLSPTARRIAVRLQAQHKVIAEDVQRPCKQFYLGAPLRFTLGLRGRRDHVKRIVAHGLNELYHTDRRYNINRPGVKTGFRGYKRAKTGGRIDQFDVFYRNCPSSPITRRRRPIPRRPSDATRQALRRGEYITAADINPSTITADELAAFGMDEARERRAQIRREIMRSLPDNDAPYAHAHRRLGELENAAVARQVDRALREAVHVDGRDELLPTAHAAGTGPPPRGGPPHGPPAAS